MISNRFHPLKQIIYNLSSYSCSSFFELAACWLRVFHLNYSNIIVNKGLHFYKCAYCLWFVPRSNSQLFADKRVNEQWRKFFPLLKMPVFTFFFHNLISITPLNEKEILSPITPGQIIPVSWKYFKNKNKSFVYMTKHAVL